MHNLRNDLISECKTIHLKHCILFIWIIFKNMHRSMPGAGKPASQQAGRSWQAGKLASQQACRQAGKPASRQASKPTNSFGLFFNIPKSKNTPKHKKHPKAINAGINAPLMLALMLPRNSAPHHPHTGRALERITINCNWSWSCIHTLAN